MSKWRQVVYVWGYGYDVCILPKLGEEICMDKLNKLDQLEVMHIHFLGQTLFIISSQSTCMRRPTEHGFKGNAKQTFLTSFTYRMPKTYCSMSHRPGFKAFAFLLLIRAPHSRSYVVSSD
jgi:hypothetical protein